MDSVEEPTVDSSDSTAVTSDQELSPPRTSVEAITQTMSQISSNNHWVLTQYATRQLEIMATVNAAVSASSYSIVCPNHGVELPLPVLVASPGADLRTVDFLFPILQRSPSPKCKCQIINFITRVPGNESHTFKVDVVLHINVATPLESRMDFEGTARLEMRERDGQPAKWIFAASLQLCKGAVSGVFDGAKEGRLSYIADWNDVINPPAGTAEWNQPGVRVRSGRWAFLLEKMYADQIQLALNKEHL